MANTVAREPAAVLSPDLAARNLSSYCGRLPGLFADQTNRRRCEPRYGADLPASGGWAPCERQSGHRRRLADRAKRFWQWLAPTLRAQDWASSIVGCRSASVRACQCVLSLPSGSTSVSESIPTKGKISGVIFEACCEAVLAIVLAPSIGETVPDSTPFAASRVSWRASMTSDWFQLMTAQVQAAPFGGVLPYQAKRGMSLVGTLRTRLVWLTMSVREGETDSSGA